MWLLRDINNTIIHYWNVFKNEWYATRYLLVCWLFFTFNSDVLRQIISFLYCLLVLLSVEKTEKSSKPLDCLHGSTSLCNILFIELLLLVFECSLYSNLNSNFNFFLAEMIDKLTLTFNRTRQAVITKELIEIISGAAALWVPVYT